MFNPNLTLKELFESNSLRNLTTMSQGPMPHKGKTYYVWCEDYSENQTVKEILNKGNKWGKDSINSYIDLTDKAHELISSRLIQYGPNSNSSSFSIKFISFYDEPNRIRISAQGWGSSSIELYDGDKEVFLQYLKDFQVR